MKLEYVPLLQVQRDLYSLPLGFERFQEYLRTMIDSETGDLSLPLVAMNPMGKEHLPLFLDGLLEMDADAEGARAVDEAERELRAEGGEFRVCLVVCDDAKGGWTNRFTNEFDYRFRQKAYAKRGWIPGLLWTSEAYTPERIRSEVLSCLYRTAYVARHGEAETLRAMLAQEGHVLRQAGVQDPQLDADDLAYTKEVLTPQLDSREYPVWIAALFGDAAARQLGYSPLGLSERAGLALARREMGTW
jgi:hypothetical protein